MKALLESFRERFDYILCDLPPITVVSDALMISPMLSGMIVVVRKNYTDMRALDVTMRQLEFTQVKVLGFVMTFDDSGETGAKRYRYGSKYGYKYSYRYDYGYYAAAEKAPPRGGQAEKFVQDFSCAGKSGTKTMIDLHTHILPNVDDGSSSLEESLALLRMLASQGVTLTAATPHFYATSDTARTVFPAPGIGVAAAFRCDGVRHALRAFGCGGGVLPKYFADAAAGALLYRLKAGCCCLRCRLSRGRNVSWRRRWKFPSVGFRWCLPMWSGISDFSAQMCGSGFLTAVFMQTNANALLRMASAGKTCVCCGAG